MSSMPFKLVLLERQVFKILSTWFSQMEQALSFIAIIRFIFARTSVITLIIARTSFELDYMISIAFGNASGIRLAVENTISQLLFFWGKQLSDPDSEFSGQALQDFCLLPILLYKNCYMISSLYIILSFIESKKLTSSVSTSCENC